MEHIFLLLIGLTVGFTGAILPGPLLVFTVERVLKYNFKEGIKVVLGHIIIEALVILSILVGIDKILNLAGNLEFTLKIFSLIGGVALIIMGAHLFSASFRYDLPIEVQDTKVRHRYGAILGGIFFTAFNPTFPIWWTTIGIPLLSRAVLAGIIGVAALITGHWLADLIWYMSVSVAVAKGKKIINKTAYHTVIKILGVLLVCFGLFFLLNFDLS